MSLPASITGAHAKKHGEDLSENDGDEDEGIFHGEQRWCMIVLKKEMSLFYNSFFFSFFPFFKCNHQTSMSHHNL